MCNVLSGVPPDHATACRCLEGRWGTSFIDALLFGNAEHFESDVVVAALPKHQRTPLPGTSGFLIPYPCLLGFFSLGLAVGFI